MLELKNIKKSFADKEVLKGINITLNGGVVYGLVGENGAGKTTLLKIISQLLTKSSGEVIINGEIIDSLDQAVKKLVLILDIPTMYEFLTCREYLEFLYSPQNLSRELLCEKINESLSQVNLLAAKDKRIKALSRGMRQRLGIACGLINNPEIILMDEPCSALDPLGRSEVLNIIENLKKENKIVILSTHILSDVEKVCDKVGLLIDGVIKVEGTVDEIIKEFSENLFKVSCDLEGVVRLVEFVSKSKFYKNCNVEKYGVDIMFEDGGKKEIMKLIASSGVDIDSIVLKKPTMDEIFILSKEN